MAPPQLARDTPVLDVVHPLVVGVDPVFGNEAHCAAVDGFFGFVGKAQAFEFAVRLAAVWRGGHSDKPLAGQHRLNHGTGTVAFRRHQRVRFDFDQETLFLQIGNHLFARGKAV